MKTRTVVLTVAAVLLTAAAAVAGGVALRPERLHFQGQVLATPRPAPDFTLTDQNGRPYQFRASDSAATVLFFGYTFCPDVCPVTMVTYRQAMKVLGRDRDRVRFVYVTVDPERDTAATLKEYLARYDPAIIGLTGTPREVQSVVDAYHIYVEITETPDSEGGYLIGHTATAFLIDSAGQIRVKFPSGTDPRVVASDCRVLLAEQAERTQAIRAENVWAHYTALPGGQRPVSGMNSAIYFRLVNTGVEADALVAVRTDVTRSAQLHRTTVEGDVMRMQRTDRLEIPPNSVVELKPGGDHVMLLGLTQNLVPGEHFPAVLVLEKAGEVPVEVEVRQE